MPPIYGPFSQGYGYPGAYGGGYPMEQGAAGGFEQRPGGGAGGMPEEAWAQQGFPVTGPNGWCLYRTKDTGEIYYHNHRTGVTTWEKPTDWTGP